MTEKQIEARMVKSIKERGGLCYKFTSPGNSGVPDRIIITTEGRTIFVELKTERGVLSKLQQYQITRMQKRNADVRVLYGWPQVKAFVEEVMPNEIYSP